jgi:ubiquinone/menaquinone biosynthesis C-methylase UbiE
VSALSLRPGRTSVEQLPPPFRAVDNVADMRKILAAGKQREALLQPRISRLPGRCFVCDSDVRFRIEPTPAGAGTKFRETLACPRCGLINRWRGCLHLFEVLCRPNRWSRIYLAESLSPVSRHLSARFPRLTTSEYIEGHAPGATVTIHETDVRNEDVTGLTFKDRSFNTVLCFDVLEHVPDYRAALEEFARVLKKGGWLVLSVPFSFRQATTVRAELQADGQIRHLVEPCYHRDPLVPGGLLSYYDFGMDLTEQMKAAGFQQAQLVCYHSRHWGYLGENVIFVAQKGRPPSAAPRRSRDYSARLQNEREFYQDCRKVHDLPDIFHYWSNKYLAPDFRRFGFASPDDFHAQSIIKYLQRSSRPNTHFVSIGSGNCDLELDITRKLVAAECRSFVFECLDINQDMLDRGLEAVRRAGLEEHFRFTCADFNDWRPQKKYGIVLANQSLHHVLNLENLFDGIKLGLARNGLFLVSDMIGRNGHMRWPEAMERLQPFWGELPESYRYNQLLKRYEPEYVNHDCSRESFEGIRAQDILPLLIERFNFEFFYPYGNMIFVFVDRPFGHNFDADAEWDRDFIDRVQADDEACIVAGTLKPTSMLAVLTNEDTETVLRKPELTPRFCVRAPTPD